MFLQLLQAIPFSFGALFPVLNPIGSAVIFLAMVNGASQAQINKLAFKVALNTVILLVVILFVGSWILRMFGITIPIVLIAGGIIVAFIGWQLLNQPADSETDSTVAPVKNLNLANIAFFPLTMPITAGPGCMAVTLTIGAHSLQPDWRLMVMSQIGNIIGLILSGLSVYFCYRYTNYITRRLGTAGTQVIMRLAAFINFCIGLQIIWHGVQLLIAAH
jgi:multiple antibiotic resistance protein